MLPSVLPSGAITVSRSVKEHLACDANVMGLNPKKSMHGKQTMYTLNVLVGYFGYINA